MSIVYNIDIYQAASCTFFSLPFRGRGTTRWVDMLVAEGICLDLQWPFHFSLCSAWLSNTENRWNAGGKSCSSAQAAGTKLRTNVRRYEAT